ncbi:hypothetical protein [Cryobacterium sp. PH31-L1]|uniref:hypothetical protein n=1 Tax=Cryobacterium sp. PH31-L1 TaxID=3046199 RepID=UPI0024B8F297|nr:hypothetical protein [Cryobacterium sp. PH31-L1]MDJ0379089.1 hypothetical protein [Cryobacterium sp. PH31-L1]
MGLVKLLATSLTGLLLTVGGTVALSSGTGTTCGMTAVNRADAAQHDAVSGYSGDQLANAADIINAGVQLGLTAQAQTLGVMTAMGESSLINLDHGDTAGPDSRSLFQQRATWGSLAERMDPTISARLFFQRLIALTGWETMTPSAAASAVQINADPEHYAPFFAPATDVVTALTASSAGACGVGGDAVALAQQLVTAADNGQLRGLVPDHLKEIRWIASGQTVPDCGIDTRILQVMVLTVNQFHQVGVSDINRKCTGQLLGAGTQSSHWINGGGGAVDFYSLGGRSLTGADGQSLRLIGLLDPVMPTGARIGQADCRREAGIRLAVVHFTQFDDTCNHLHLDVAFTADPMTVG